MMVETLLTGLISKGGGDWGEDPGEATVAECKRKSGSQTQVVVAAQDAATTATTTATATSSHHALRRR